MTEKSKAFYEQWLKNNEDMKHTRHVGGYWRYIDRYLHDKTAIVDGCDFEFRMKHREPMSANTYLIE